MPTLRIKPLYRDTLPGPTKQQLAELEVSLKKLHAAWRTATTMGDCYLVVLQVVLCSSSATDCHGDIHIQQLLKVGALQGRSG